MKKQLNNVSLCVVLTISMLVKAQVKDAAIGTCEDGQNIITWNYSKKEIPVNIYWSTSLENLEEDKKLLAENIKGTSYTFYAPDREVQGIHKAQTNKRVYYSLVSKDGKTMVIAERKIERFDNVSKLDKFKPINNFRDVGGYYNKERKRVKWGKIFRTNELSNLTDTEIEFVKQLDITTIFDLRSEKEIKNLPDVNIGAEMIYLKAPDDKTPEDSKFHNPEERLKIWSSIVKSDRNMYNFMIESNKKFVTDYIPLYRRIFEVLTTEKPGESFLGHCSGGKDRTGAYIAVILSALEVPRETIMKDYLLTGIYRKKEDDLELSYVKKLNNFSENEMAIIEPVWKVYPEYLQAFFDTVDEKYGSMDNYLENECGLTKKKKAQLKKLYLED